MSRIDIAVKLNSTTAGFREPIASAPRAEWMSLIRDVRDVFVHLSGYEGKIITMLSFCRTGCIITLIRPIQGKTDNVAAWLHIPANCVISGEELCRLLGEVKAVLKTSAIAQSDINALASKEYPDKPVALDYMPSAREGAYAFRRTDFFPMKEILGEGRYQEYYTPYKGVFLLEATDTMKAAGNVADITTNPIEPASVLIPPTQQEIEDVLGKGVNLLLVGAGGRLTFFKQAVPLKRGATVTVQAFREGFDQLPIQVKLHGDIQEFAFPEGFTPVWKKTLGRKNFQVVDQMDQPVLNPVITFDGKDLPVTGVPLTEEQLRKGTLLVTADGYDKYEGPCPPIVKDNVQIVLQKGTTRYKYSVVLKDGIEGQLTFATDKHFGHGSSPLPGYIAGTGASANTLYFDDNDSKKSFWKGVIITAGAAIILLLAVLILSRPKSKPEPQEPETPVVEVTDTSSTQTEPKVEEPAPPILTPAQRYLHNPVWHKDSLDIYCPGLFEALNYYDFRKTREILDRYSDIPRVKAVLDGMMEAGSKGGQYIPADKKDVDKEITVDRYVQKLSPAR